MQDANAKPTNSRTRLTWSFGLFGLIAAAIRRFIWPVLARWGLDWLAENIAVIERLRSLLAIVTDQGAEDTDVQDKAMKEGASVRGSSDLDMFTSWAQDF